MLDQRTKPMGKILAEYWTREWQNIEQKTKYWTRELQNVGQEGGKYGQEDKYCTRGRQKIALEDFRILDARKLERKMA